LDGISETDTLRPRQKVDGVTFGAAASATEHIFLDVHEKAVRAATF
jgi:hypothetical protein